MGKQAIEFEKLGAKIFAISSDSKEYLLDLKKDKNISFPLLIDNKLRATSIYGLRDWEGGIRTLRPATVIIGKDNFVKYVKIGHEPGEHPSIKELLKSVKDLAA